MTTEKTKTPPWMSQKIWMAALGVIAAVVAFAFGQPELGGTILTATVAGFLIGRGLERFGAGLLVVVALSLTACESGAQVPSTCLSTAIRAAMDVIADCLPRSDDPAVVREALEACPIEREPPYLDEP